MKIPTPPGAPPWPAPFLQRPPPGRPAPAIPGARDPGDPRGAGAADRPDPLDSSHPRWLDWRWQLSHTLRGAALARRLGADPDTVRWLADAEAGAAGRAFASGATPYFASLCMQGDAARALRRQVLPDRAEQETAPHEHLDPLDEERHRVAPGLVHRYRDRVLLLVTDACASYCRHCTRSRWVGGGGGEARRAGLEAALSWIARHGEIADVLVSGGDPLLLSSDRLGELLDRLCAIEHLRLVRVGTRVPIFLPMRLDPELAHALRPRRIPVWVNVHINHHGELTAPAREGLGLLADAGVPLGGQTVLLRGVNDAAETLRETFYAMLSSRVRPYYLFHCDPVRGTAHLRPTLRRGLELLGELIGQTSGMALPRYCVDLRGAGKIPLLPTGVEVLDPGAVRVRGHDGRLWTCPDP